MYDLQRHLAERDILTWGSYGKDGRQAVCKRTISELADDHLVAILDTQNLSQHLSFVMHYELEYRAAAGIEVPEYV